MDQSSRTPNPRLVTQVALSVLSGVLIPFFYTIVAGPLSTYIQNDGLRRALNYPIRWPVIILTRLLPWDSFPFRDGDELFLLLFIAISDVLVYSILSFTLLQLVWKPKTQQLDPPP